MTSNGRQNAIKLYGVFNNIKKHHCLQSSLGLKVIYRGRGLSPRPPACCKSGAQPTKLFRPDFPQKSVGLSTQNMTK